MPYIGNPIYQSAFVTDQFSGNGSTTAFTMSVAPAGTTNVLVVVSGVVQDPSTYGVVGNTLTFSTAPPSGTGNISCRYLGVPVTGVTTTAYRTVTEFTATAGQTTFTPPSYTVGYINVYRNGVRLGTADFTASNGTTVVLATGATAGDLITTESFYVSSVLNAIPTTGGTISGNLFINGVETVGSGTPISGATNPIVVSTGNSNNYVQSYIVNNNSAGANASADFTAYPSNGADSAGWVDMGITGPNFSQSAYSVTGPNEAYLFGSAPSGASKTGNLVLATDSTGTANAIQFYTGGFTKAKSAAAMHISSAGNVGIGTVSPVTNSNQTSLTINGTSYSRVDFQVGGSSTAYLYSGATNTNLGTTGSTFLAFDTNATERMRIDSGGRTVIGGTTGGSYFNNAKLTVYGDGICGKSDSGIAIGSETAGGTTFGALSLGQSFGAAGVGDFNLLLQSNAGKRIYMQNRSAGVYLSDGGTSWTSNSDERIKKNLVPIENAAEKVATLRTVIGEYIDDELERRRPFLIAQDVDAVLPEAVDKTKEDVWGVQYADVIPLLAAAIKEQQEIIKQLQADVEALKAGK